MLAWWLGRTAATDWDNIRAAADYLMAERPAHGPGALGEPGRLLAEHDRDGDRRARVRRRRRAAQRRRRQGGDLRGELPTSGRRRSRPGPRQTNGEYSPKPYYLRLTKDGNPDSTDTKVQHGRQHHVGDVDQRKIVDQSFLGLVLFGAKRFDDQTVVNSLVVGDKIPPSASGHADRGGVAPLHVRRLRGAGRRRRLGPVHASPAGQTSGRLWPLLSGRARRVRAARRRRRPRPRLRTIAGAANDGLMLPEQVWDGRAAAGAQTPGTGTRSGTPLMWTHAQFVRLAWSIDAGRPSGAPGDRGLPLPEAALPARALSATGPTRPGTPRPGSSPG